MRDARAPGFRSSRTPLGQAPPLVRRTSCRLSRLATILIAVPRHYRFDSAQWIVSGATLESMSICSGQRSTPRDNFVCSFVDILENTCFVTALTLGRVGARCRPDSDCPVLPLTRTIEPVGTPHTGATMRAPGFIMERRYHGVAIRKRVLPPRLRLILLGLVLLVVKSSALWNIGKKPTVPWAKTETTVDIVYNSVLGAVAVNRCCKQPDEWPRKQFYGDNVRDE